MKKYYGTWGANSSSYGRSDGNNLRELSRTLARIVRGNVFKGNQGGYSVYRQDEPEPLMRKVIKL